MRMTKKITSIVLAVMMVVSMMSVMAVTANAAVGDFVPESEYLTFTAIQDDSSVMMIVQSGSDFKYNKNGDGWHDYNPDDYKRIYLNKGEYVRFRGSDFVSYYSGGSFSIGGKVAASGNIMSLRLDSESRSQGLTEACFHMMFERCYDLITAPELPETTLAEYCYEGMFNKCTNLTKAPKLPATTLTRGCYSDMFNGCTSLTAAPALPATSLAYGCYHSMFEGCTSLTELPELPATSLAEACYYGMFDGCSSIRISDEAGTFSGIKYSEAYRIPTEGTATNASYALNSMFASTGGKFKGTPSLNTTYYIGKPVYTVTWKNGDTVIETDTDVESGATPTFNGTTPEKASDTYYDYTFSGWSPAIAPVSADVTYTAQFTATAKTFKVFAKKLTGGTYTIENLTGETTVAQLKEIIADQIDIPATAQRLIFAGMEIEDAKTLAEYNIQKESTIHVVAKTYTVTWLNYDNSELGTANVAYGNTPTYDGAIPTKTADDSKHYTFSGWSNGTTTYGLTDTLPAVTADVTYTAQFTESAHSFNSNPVFNWTQDASTGDWNCNKLTLTCTDCDVTQDYDVAGFFGASAVTCTANTDGSFTYSVSKKVGGTTYSDAKTYDADHAIASTTQLKAAAKKGGSWNLEEDLTGVTDVQCANGFVLDGKNHTVTRHANVSTQAVFRTTTNPAEVTLKNLTIDGIAGQSDAKPAVATKMSNPSNGNVINLENVTITNYDFDAANNGVVLAWGQATVNMKNCTVETDSTYDVWGGAASTINVDGGKAGTVYLNGGTASAALTNGAVVDSFATSADNKIKDNGDGTYCVVPRVYVAQVGSTKYENLQDALDVVPDGGTVTVLKDIETSGNIFADGFVSGGNRTYTVDLGGYTVSGGTFVVSDGNNVTFTNGTIESATYGIQNTATATVDSTATVKSTAANASAVYGAAGSTTVINGTVEGNKYGVIVKGGELDVAGKVTATNSDGRAIALRESASADINDGADVEGTFGVVVYTNSAVNVNGGEVKGVSHAISGNGRAADGPYTINVTGGSVTATNGAAIYNPNATGTMNISGGTITGSTTAVAAGENSTNNISGGTFSSAVPEEYCANGYAPKDNGNGTYGVGPDTSSPLNPLMVAAADINDGNAFGINSDYLNGTLLGVQKKNAVDDAEITSQSHQENGSDMRFIAVLDTELLNEADDYGFVLGKVDGSRTYTDTNINKLVEGAATGIKKISAKGTYNTVCGTNYGDPASDTPYKYVTCAVNGVDTSSKIVARFYYTKGGKTYFAKYAGQDYKYTGCMAGINASGNIY